MAGDTSPVIRLLVWIFKKALKTGWLFLEALARAGWWLLWRILDLICLAMWVVAVCSVVRTHSALRNFGWVLNHYEDFGNGNGKLMDALRIVALIEFFMLFVDYPTYLVTLIVYVTPWRCYKLHAKMREHYKLDFAADDDYVHMKWREKAWWQFWLWVLDLFTVPFCVVVFLTGYRARHLVHKLKTAETDYEVRKAMVVEFLNLLVDLPCIALALALCCTWRVPWILSRAAFIWNSDIRHNSDSDVDTRINRLRSLPFHELWTLVLDVPVIAAALVCTVLPWRLYYAKKDVENNTQHRLGWQANSSTPVGDQRRKSWNSRISYRREYWRHVGWAFVEQAGKAFCDILALVGCVIIATAGVWRIPMLIRDIWPTTAMIRDPNRRYSRDHYMMMPMRFHESVALQLAKWLMDIPCIVAGAVVLGTVWRANVLLSVLRDPDYRGPGWGKRARIACVTQLLRLVTDVLLLVPMITVAVTVWRAGPLLASYRSRRYKIAQKAKAAHFQDAVAYKNGWAIMRQFVLLLLDLLLGVLALVVYCTLWRAWPLHKSTKKRIRKLKFPGDELNPDYVFQDAVLTLNFKAVLRHFGLLLVDLVALPIGLGLLLTWRAPAVVSGLAGSGDFYNFFALTIFTEFGRFLVDIPCLLWFLLMLIFRPIGSVTLLLEDSKHKRVRLLRARMGEMRDIWGKRKAVLSRLDEMALACLKHGIQPAGMSILVQRTNTSSRSTHEFDGDDWLDGEGVSPVWVMLYGDGSTQTGETDWFIPLFPIEDAMKDYLATLNAHHERTSGLSDHYTHLMDQVIAIEAKRPRKIMRLYHAEYAFMARPDLRCHADNIKLVTAEMEAFDQAAEDAAKAVSEFTPATPPLWSRSTGFSTRSRSQTQWVLLQIATTGYFAFVALLLLNTVLVYRLPQVVRNVRAHWWNRHAVLRGSLVEYGKDFGALMCMLLVTCGLYRSMQLYSDMAVALFEHRSWTAARGVAFFCAGTFLSDIRELLCVPLRWGTYSFTAIALMWGVLVPIDLFQPTFGMAIGLIIWAAFTAFPFAFTFDIAGDIAAGAGGGAGASHDGIDGALMAFIGTLLLVLAVATRGMHRRGEFHRPPEFKFFKLNWENVNTIFSELLEFVQITALTYQIGIPMRHSGFATAWSGYFLLSFIPTDAMFYTMVVLFIVWYFVASAPPVLEQVTGRKSEGRISSSVLWKLATVLLTDTLFITMAEACLSTVRCRSDGHGGRYFLEDYGSGELECWQGSHRAIAGFSLFALFWYTVTSLLYNGKYALGSTRHDFQFAALYMVLNNLIKLAMVSVAIVLSARPMVAVSILAGLNLLALLMTWRFSSLAGYPASTAKTALVWKLGAFIGTTWANAVAVVGVVMDDAESVFPLYAVAAGWGVLLVGLVLYTATRIPRSQHEVGREDVKKTLLELEAQLEAEGALLTLHPQARKAWRWKIAHVREAKWISMEEHSEMAYVQVVNEDLCCPITMEMLVDPVKTPYGHCFERSAIVHWVNDNGTCPLTRQRLVVDQLKPASEIIAKMAQLQAAGREDKLSALHDNPAGLADLASATLAEQLGGGRWGPTPLAETSPVAQDLGESADGFGPGEWYDGEWYAEVGDGISSDGVVDPDSTADSAHVEVERTLAAMGFAVTAEVRAFLQANDYNIASTVTMLIAGQAEPPPGSLVRGGTNGSVYEGFGADDGSDAAVPSSLARGGTNGSVYAGFANDNPRSAAAAASNVFQVTLECENGLGLRITDGPSLAVGPVDPGGVAEKAGIRYKDQIVSVNGVEMRDLTRPEATQKLKELMAGTSTLVCIICRTGSDVVPPGATRIEDPEVNPVDDASPIQASPEASGEETEEEKFVFDSESNSIRLTSVRTVASDGDVVQHTPDVGFPTSPPALPPSRQIDVPPAAAAGPGDPTARRDRAARSSSYAGALDSDLAAISDVSTPAVLATGTAPPPSFADPPPPSFADYDNVAVKVIVPVGAPPKADVPADEDWNRSWSAGTGVFADDGDDYDGDNSRGDPRAHPYYGVVRMFRQQKAGTAAARSTFDGRSALLELERAIRYDRLAFWFVAGRDKWRAAVEEASWLGLQQATAVLQRAVDEGKFHSPAPEWQLAALPEDAMQPDFDEVMLAPYFDHANDDPATVKTRSAQLRADLLAAFRNVMEPTAEPAIKLLDTLLPVGTIDRWSCDGSDYTVRLVHDARGKLTKVGAGGVAAAKGATLRWQEEFTISMVGGLRGFDLSDGALKAGKGPVSVSVNGCRVLGGDGPTPKFEVTYNGSKEKAVKIQKVLCTLDTFVWS